jgi:predicted phage terminase large subunit-like protein
LLAEAKKRGITLAETQKREPPSLADFVEATVNFTLHDWQREHLCPILERCRTEKGLRIAIHGPPQYGKSVIVGQRLPAWLIGTDPTHRVGLACYNETHATGFGQVVKDIILSPSFQEAFPGVAVRKDAPAGRFMTAQRLARADAQPSFLAMGLLSGFTGKGVDTLIVDDPYASSDDAHSETINEKVWRWWSQTAGVRIPEESNVIVMFHRYHEDDFAGRLLATGKFEYVRFPAIADADSETDPTGREPGELLSPMRSRTWLEEQEQADPKVFLGQFQGKPRPDEGAFFHREWFNQDHYDPPKLALWVRAWDLAFTAKETGDFTVGALVGVDEQGAFHIRDVVRFREEWPIGCEMIARTTESDLELAAKEGFTYHVGVEAVASQTSFYKDLVQKGIDKKVPMWPIRFSGQDKDKKARASIWASRGKVLGIHLHDWTKWDKQAFLAECLSFTGQDIDKHDDQVDAVSNAAILLYQLRGKSIAQTEEDRGRRLSDYAKLAKQYN